MKVAVIGSRKLNIISLDEYLPCGITEIVSGGAKGIDMCAREFAYKNNIPLTEFLPEYEKYSRAAPIKRNIQIVEYSDRVIAFRDGHIICAPTEEVSCVLLCRGGYYPPQAAGEKVNRLYKLRFVGAICNRPWQKRYVRTFRANTIRPYGSP